MKLSTTKWAFSQCSLADIVKHSQGRTVIGDVESIEIPINLGRFRGEFGQEFNGVKFDDGSMALSTIYISPGYSEWTPPGAPEIEYWIVEPIRS